MEDWAILFRAYRESRFANIQEVVLGYRECTLSFRKLALARWHQSRFILENARAGGEYAGAFMELGRQTAKIAVDAFALGTGLKYRALQHRVPPITHDELEDWREVRQAARAAALHCVEERESVPA